MIHLATETGDPLCGAAPEWEDGRLVRHVVRDIAQVDCPACMAMAEVAERLATEPVAAIVGPDDEVIVVDRIAVTGVSLVADGSVAAEFTYDISKNEPAGDTESGYSLEEETSALALMSEAGIDMPRGPLSPMSEAGDGKEE